MIKETDNVLREALDYTHTLVADLSPPVLQEFGLSAALGWLATQMERYDLKVTVKDPVECPIPEDQGVLLFQSVRELLINVSKHAEADQAIVSLRCSEHTLRLEVRHRGRGFDITSHKKATDGSSKFGFFSIAGIVTVPINANWNVHGGVELQTFGENVKAYNAFGDGDRGAAGIGSIGIGFSF